MYICNYLRHPINIILNKDDKHIIRVNHANYESSKTEFFMFNDHLENC